MNNIRSPTAGYPPSYAPYPTNQPSSYSYPAVPDPRTVPHALSAMGHQTQHMHAVPPRTDRMTSSRNETRSASPYGPSSSAIPTGTHIQHPAAPPAAEEPVIKKKRKRADAAQLRVLNDTYNRTAFPSVRDFPTNNFEWN
jgi:homeobox protein YOX1/YHP1